MPAGRVVAWSPPSSPPPSPKRTPKPLARTSDGRLVVEDADDLGAMLAFKRSIGLVECSLGRCADEKLI